MFVAVHIVDVFASCIVIVIKNAIKNNTGHTETQPHTTTTILLASPTPTLFSHLSDQP